MTTEKPASDAGDNFRRTALEQELCAVLVGGSPCGERRATHENGTLYVHAFAPDGTDRPNPQLRFIEVGGLADDFATGF